MNLTLKSALAVFGGVAIMLPLATLAQVNDKNQRLSGDWPEFRRRNRGRRHGLRAHQRLDASPRSSRRGL